jgi:hypothetical protein
MRMRSNEYIVLTFHVQTLFLSLSLEQSIQTINKSRDRDDVKILNVVAPQRVPTCNMNWKRHCVLAVLVDLC